jgi:hypothetical protein
VKGGRPITIRRAMIERSVATRVPAMPSIIHRGRRNMPTPHPYRLATRSSVRAKAKRQTQSSEPGILFVLELLGWALLLLMAYVFWEQKNVIWESLPFPPLLNAVLVSVAVALGQLIRAFLLEIPMTRDEWKAVAWVALTFTIRQILLTGLLALAISLVEWSTAALGVYFVAFNMLAIVYIFREIALFFVESLLVQGDGEKEPRG